MKFKGVFTSVTWPTDCCLE